MKIADLKSSLMSVSFVMNKDSKILGEGPVSLPHKIFFYLLTAFNIFFLSYVLTVGYYNRLSLDDYAYLGAMRDNGFLSPFTYWYSHWQGRFGPQFLLNFVFLVYDVTSNLLFYPILLSSLFAYSIYQILNYYFSLPKRVLLNYSILLFAALLLTGFELSTFFWVNASTMYFGGMLFALLGIVFILKENQSYFRYVVVAICFLYAGSSSEHVGILACFLLFSASFISFYKLDWNFRNFIANPTNKRLLVALFFCSVAFIIMILAPGNKIRIAASAQVNDPILLLKKTYKATMFVCGHLFYKLPYFITFIPPFLLFGSFLKPSKTHNLSVGFVLVICAIAILSLIYTGNLPMAYTHNGAGPLRAYVYITFSVVCLLFLICFYIGRHYRSRLKYLVVVSILSLAILFVMLFYTFYMELPLLRKYNQSDKQRIAILNEYTKRGRTEPVFLPPLYNPEYTTITEMWRNLTYTYKLPSGISDMPVVIGEITETPSESTYWRNGHLKHGLGLNFDVFLEPKTKQPDQIK